MRRFELWRNTDVNGMSGTGIVAEGVEFSDGTAAMRWKTDIATTSVAPNVNHFNYIHGHEGATRVVWVDDSKNNFEVGEEVAINNPSFSCHQKIATVVHSDWYNDRFIVNLNDSRLEFGRDTLREVEPILTDPSKV